MFLLFVLFFFPTAYEENACGKQGENIESSDDEGHNELPPAIPL
jgi:hypothetical protein